MLKTAVLLLSLVLVDQAPQSALKIVVVEGEAGVNIIQQKTAVRPVIEVRDRNNLPVSGALVTFSIEGGKAATFGGASTITVATNAAGQAAVSGLTPNIAGAFQIQVSAAFQGQVATAAIAQTNVLTAAEAAAAASGGAGSAGASGGAGGGGGAGAGGAAGGAGAGGGLSATTIAVAGAAVAGGAVAAVKVADTVSGGATFTGSFSGVITGVSEGPGANCTFTYTISNAEARLKFDSTSDSGVSGNFDYQGPSSLTASTCTGPTPTIPQFIGETGSLSGPPTNFSGRKTLTFSGGLPAGPSTGENNYIFQGSINGDSATGTFTYQQKSVGSTPLGNITINASGTFPITFTKQ